MTIRTNKAPRHLPGATKKIKRIKKKKFFINMETSNVNKVQLKASFHYKKD